MKMGNRPSILLVAKRPGITSFVSLYPIKRTIDPKVGHAGTLDKFAEGLLIALTGAMTRLNPLFSGLDKEYVATILFGQQTDTLDPEGIVVRSGPVPELGMIKETIKRAFFGQLKQIPPEYSAVHVDGRRSYSLARSGHVPDLPARDIRIDAFEVLSWDAPLLVARIAVSKGTYIRSIARDLGLACGSCARLERLVRTRIGPYELAEAVDPEDRGALENAVIHTEELLERLPVYGRMVVDDDALFPLANGRIPRQQDMVSMELDPDDRYAGLYSHGGRLHAVASLKEDGSIDRIIAQIPEQERR
jgi:tRNA pseudouridine55 synthase